MMDDEDKRELDNRSDEELVELIKEGYSQAIGGEIFGVLVKRHINHIYNFVRQYTPQKENAEDITQDAFFKTWKHMKRFKKGSKFTTWLFTIARNTALDHIKKRKAVSFSELEDNLDEPLESTEILSDPEPLPPELFERDELASELTKAMEHIHPDHRAVLIMHYEDGLTFQEISGVLDRPMNTIKSWHHRAISKMRDVLTAPKAS